MCTTVAWKGAYQADDVQAFLRFATQNGRVEVCTSRNIGDQMKLRSLASGKVSRPSTGVSNHTECNSGITLGLFPLGLW